MSKWRRVFGVLAIILLLFGAWLTPLFSNKVVVIVSGSMEPTIHVNAMALVHLCDISEAKEGDIIVYYHPRFNELITHRCIEVGEDYIWTKGDANADKDDIAVIADNFYGKVRYVANWAAPIMSNYVSDRQFDKASMVSALFQIALIGSVVWVLIALSGVYLLAYHFVCKRPSYDMQEVQHLQGIVNRAAETVASAQTLTRWQQVKLRVAYRVLKRELIDIEDELNKL